jgi:hypothetical protein
MHSGHRKQRDGVESDCLSQVAHSRHDTVETQAMTPAAKPLCIHGCRAMHFHGDNGDRSP